MNPLQAIADRVEIEALRGEFTDAAMMREYERFASLFTEDGAWRLPYVNVEFVGRAQIRAGLERAQEALWDFFVQSTHPGMVQFEGDSAVGRAYVFEFGRLRDGRSQAHHSLYHDRYRRTPEGWKFAERVYEIRYLDTSQLAGSAPAPRDLDRKEHRMTNPVDQILADTSEPPLPDGVWKVARSRSEIGFAVKEMWGLRTVRGVFGAYDGTLKVRAGDATGELTIEAASLDTGNDRRDRHLRSPAFFDVERHPRIVFTATAVTPLDGGLAVTGELAIGSSRVRLEIPAGAEQTAAGALRLEATTTVSREAAGVAWNKLGAIRGDAVLYARLTLERATSPPAGIAG